jgi:hypothetical protein
MRQPSFPKKVVDCDWMSFALSRRMKCLFRGRVSWANVELPTMQFAGQWGDYCREKIDCGKPGNELGRPPPIAGGFRWR